MITSSADHPHICARAMRTPMVVMGVSGCGKSTIGIGLARELQLPFLEGDTLHGEHNVEKMRRGEPLDDADRTPWLDAIAAALADERRYPRGLVTTCSALKRAYRDRLRRAAPALRFVFLEASREVIAERMRARRHHFMPESLLASQFATLERPARDETDIAIVDASGSAAEVLAAVLVALHESATTG